jgi:hypothetical protein
MFALPAIAAELDHWPSEGRDRPRHVISASRFRA